MSKLGERLLQAAREANAFARGEHDPSPLVPNAETVAAMEAARRGEHDGRVATVAELFAQLHTGEGLT
jgi:hypothetical protein